MLTFTRNVNKRATFSSSTMARTKGRKTGQISSVAWSYSNHKFVHYRIIFFKNGRRLTTKHLSFSIDIITHSLMLSGCTSPKPSQAISLALSIASFVHSMMNVFPGLDYPALCLWRYVMTLSCELESLSRLEKEVVSTSMRWE